METSRFFPVVRFAAFRRGCSAAAVLLPHLLDALGLGLLRRIPAVLAHFLIDIALHADGAVQRGMEGLMHGRRVGLDGAVQIQVAHALGGQQQVFHDLLVVHFSSSLYQLVERVKQLLIVADQALRLLLQDGVGQLACRRAALRHQKLGVPQRVFDIEQFFGTHDLHLISDFTKRRRLVLAFSMCGGERKKRAKSFLVRIGKRREMW